MADLVLLHGFCETSKMWEGTKDHLTDLGHRVFAVDLPGFGVNTKVVNSITEMADDVVGFCQENKLTTAIFLGHSLGGYVILDILSHYPSMVQAVGMIHSHAQSDDAFKIENRNKLINFVQEHGTAPFLKEFSKQLISAKTNSEAVLKQAYDLVKNTRSEGVIAASKAMINRSDYRMLLPTFNVPFLWLVGRDDSFIQFDEILTQAASCNMSMLKVLDNVGHLSLFENPTKAVSVITEFIDWVSETD